MYHMTSKLVSSVPCSFSSQEGIELVDNRHRHLRHRHLPTPHPHHPRPHHRRPHHRPHRP